MEVASLLRWFCITKSNKVNEISWRGGGVSTLGDGGRLLPVRSWGGGVAFFFFLDLLSPRVVVAFLPYTRCGGLFSLRLFSSWGCVFFFEVQSNEVNKNSWDGGGVSLLGDVGGGGGFSSLHAVWCRCSLQVASFPFHGVVVVALLAAFFFDKLKKKRKQSLFLLVKFLFFRGGGGVGSSHLWRGGGDFCPLTWW